LLLAGELNLRKIPTPDGTEGGSTGTVFNFTAGFCGARKPKAFFLFVTRMAPSPAGNPTVSPNAVY